MSSCFACEEITTPAYRYILYNTMCFVFQYFGDKTAPAVKEKCIELLYKWSIDLRHEPKILDAYEMLKRQGKQLVGSVFKSVSLSNVKFFYFMIELGLGAWFQKLPAFDWGDDYFV